MGPENKKRRNIFKEQFRSSRTYTVMDADTPYLASDSSSGETVGEQETKAGSGQALNLGGRGPAGPSRGAGPCLEGRGGRGGEGRGHGGGLSIAALTLWVRGSGEAREIKSGKGDLTGGRRRWRRRGEEEEEGRG